MLATGATTLFRSLCVSGIILTVLTIFGRRRSKVGISSGIVLGVVAKAATMSLVVVILITIKVAVEERLHLVVLNRALDELKESEAEHYVGGIGWTLSIMPTRLGGEGRVLKEATLDVLSRLGGMVPIDLEGNGCNTEREIAKSLEAIDHRVIMLNDGGKHVLGRVGELVSMKHK